MENNQNSTSFNDFFSFRKFISLTFIQIIYVLGAIAITIAGFVSLYKASEARYGAEMLALSGLGIIILGNILWRVICEAWILFFRLASSVSNIENQLKSTTKSFSNDSININNESELICESCGKVQSDADSEFCEECGNKL
jgi:hypothetical protein